MPWPRKTSTCRSFVTISSGLCRLLAIVVLLHGQNHTSRWTRPWGPISPRKHGVFVVIEAHGASLRHRGGDAMEAVEAPGIGNEAGAFFLEHVPDRALALLGVSARLCPGD